MKKENKNEEQKTSGAIVLGILFGITAGCVIYLLVDQLMWMAIGPAIGMLTGVAIASVISNKNEKKA